MIILKRTSQELEEMISKLDYDEKYEIRNEDGIVILFKKGNKEFILFYNNKHELVYFQSLNYEPLSKL